jgi:sec-independent protein translocase protein TatA
MPFHMGPMEIGIILVIVLIIFGVGKLPQVGGAIGKSIREFRKEKEGIEDKAESKDIAQSSETNEKKE